MATRKPKKRSSSRREPARAEGQPKLAVFKLASCDGCQLTLLDCEDELLSITDHVEIAHFLEASSRTLAGPYDVTLVEGSITTERDFERIRQIRDASKFLVTIGACATAGGIQSLRNSADIEAYRSLVYASPEYLSTLDTSTPVRDHVHVDFELHGCPISKRQLIELLTALLMGRRPNILEHSVCVDCKVAGAPCVMVTRNTPCLGPVTRTGCDALCPRHDRGCFGCFGPTPDANLASLADWWRSELDVPARDIVRAHRTFNTANPALGRLSESYDGTHED